MVYKEKDAKFEDSKSTAYTFLFVGAAGIVFLVLMNTGIIKIPMTDYMKTMMTIVMAILFLIFLAIGFMHFKGLKQMSADAKAEENKTTEISTWFTTTYSADQLDEALHMEPGTAMEQKYFTRSEYMRKLLETQYPGLKEDYMEHLIELLYGALFPEK